MMLGMFHTIRNHLACALVAVAVCSSGAMAQDEEPSDRPDARVEGYQVSDTQVGRIAIENPNGTALTWFVLAGLGVLSLGVMFKSGRRTHLD